MDFKKIALLYCKKNMRQFIVYLFVPFTISMSHADHSIVIDSPESLELAEKMAENNDTEAAVRVGEFYLFGHAHYRNYERALELLTKASKRGNLEAIELMAGMYLNGRGVDQDIMRAAKLYEIAAVRGHGPCQFNLGIIYKNGGEGFHQNPKLAYYWLYKASLNRDALGDMIYDAASFRNDIANLLTQEERMAIVDQIQKESKRIIKEK